MKNFDYGVLTLCIMTLSLIVADLFCGMLDCIEKNPTVVLIAGTIGVISFIAILFGFVKFK